MSKPATYPLRLPESIRRGAIRLASRDGVSLNQFISTAVAEKLSAMETLEVLEKRAQKANMEEFWHILNRSDAEPPRKGDELPEGYISPIEGKG